MPERLNPGQWSRAADGNFVLPRPAVALPFTGERMTSDIEGQIAFEHLHRYCVARYICAGKDVLDVASGEGYGSALLAGVARRVVGVEIDVASVTHARNSYAAVNLEFLQGDALALPLADATFDVVVSFETLEHLRNQWSFLNEIRRVLRPEGVLVISTPDRDVYSAPGQPVNRFHVLELSRPEFAALLGDFFVHHRILKQRPLLGSVMAPFEDSEGGWRSYERRAVDVLEATPGLSRAFYLIGVASDLPIPELGSSIYSDSAAIDEALSAVAALKRVRQEAGRERAEAEQALLALQRERDQLILAVERRTQENAQAQAQHAQAQAEHAQAQAEHVQAQAEHAQAQAEHAQAQAELVQAQAEHAQAQAALIMSNRQVEGAHEQLRYAAERNATLSAQLDLMQASTWWRVGAPLRATGRRFPGVARLIRRTVKAGYWILTGRIFTRLRQRRAYRHRALTPTAGMREALSLPCATDLISGPRQVLLPPADHPVISVV